MISQGQFWGADCQFCGYCFLTLFANLSGLVASGSVAQ